MEDGASRHSLHELVSPDGTQQLSMVGGKVFRHPPVTETICRRKHLAKRMLDLAGVPVPAGGDFSPQERAAAAAYFEKVPKPAVLKPTDSGSSQGVTVGVRTAEEFDAAWKHALDGSRGRSNVMIERFVEGVELRAYVVGEDVVSVVARIQPFVVGDGKSNVEELISTFHESRSVHYRAMKMPAVVDWPFVEKQGLSRDSVAPEDSIVLLNPFCYPTIGAYIVDVTSVVSEGIVDMARGAKNAIPGLEVAGVDILVGDIRDASSALVVEVNTAASLDMHRYPTHGRARDVDRDVVDYFHKRYGIVE